MDPHLVSLLSPGSYEAEQYRTLRFVIEMMHKDPGLQVLAVTSPVAGDGKTTTAVNLAGALSQASDARVLLICADLRRPSIGVQLGLSRRPSLGITDVILNPQRVLADAVQRLPAFNLFVVTAGRTTTPAYEILKLPRLADVLNEARRQYDYVILDTPPIVLVPDSRLIGQWIDGFLLVVGAHKTPRRFVQEALSLMDPKKVLGLVFNGEDRPLSRYYGYYQPYVQAQAPPRTGWWRRLIRALRSPLRRK